MAIDVRWHEFDAVIYAHLSGDMDIREFAVLDRQILKLVEESDRHLVHIWVDLRDVTKFPANVPQVHSALTHKNHPRVGWTVMLTNNRLIKFVGYMITQIAKARFRSFETEAEARAFLESMDQQIKFAPPS